MTDWWWAYLALGAFVGFFSGLLGIGGGSATVPVLAFVFAAKGFPQSHVVHLALGTGITSILFTSAASVRSHHLRNAVNWRVLRMMTAGIVVGTFTGALLAGTLDVRLLSIAFTVLIFYFATQMLITHAPKATGRLPSAPAMSAFGAGIGFISSLSATGGASIVVPFLVKRNIPIHEAIGTAAAIGWPIAAAGAAGYILGGLHTPGMPQYSLGYVYLPALAGVVIASVLMAPVGAAIAHRTPGRTLRKVFAIVLFALATTMLLKFI
ncbi:MAG TPA: sulfite exporter TauE/SafE family protein [Burkholderiales bacterium]|nr:sulfite exporter TauE/SafE family protein [Burkholderiales bacterium]